MLPRFWEEQEALPRRVQSKWRHAHDGTGSWDVARGAQNWHWSTRAPETQGGSAKDPQGPPGHGDSSVDALGSSGSRGRGPRARALCMAPGKVPGWPSIRGVSSAQAGRLPPGGRECCWFPEPWRSSAHSTAVRPGAAPSGAHSADATLSVQPAGPPVWPSKPQAFLETSLQFICGDLSLDGFSGFCPSPPGFSLGQALTPARQRRRGPDAQPVLPGGRSSGTDWWEVWLLPAALCLTPAQGAPSTGGDLVFK